MLSDKLRTLLSRETEVSWSQGVISKTEVASLRKRLKRTYRFASGDAGAPVITVSFARQSYFEDLVHKFGPSADGPSNLTLFFDEPSRRDAELAFGRWDQSIETAVVAGNGFGLLKSLVSGVASIKAMEERFMPVHAAALRLQNTGALIVGASGFGKTTACLSIMQAARTLGADVEISGDDWCVLSNCRRTSCYSHTFDPSISVTKEAYRFLSEEQKRHCDTVFEEQGFARKVSIPSSDLKLWGKASPSIKVDRIYLLDPTSTSRPTQAVESAQDFSTFLQLASYHYPLHMTDSYRDHCTDMFSTLEVFWLRPQADQTIEQRYLNLVQEW